MIKTNKKFRVNYLRLLRIFKKLKKINILIYIFIFVFVISCFSDNTIIPGKGINDLNFNIKYKNINVIKNKYEKMGVYLTFDNDELTSIMIINPNFTTKEGIKVGQTKNNIIKIYGNPIKENNLELSKSKMNIGIIGYLLVYNGIEFIIDNDIIIGIIIKDGGSTLYDESGLKVKNFEP
jgi:hypothetical protein